MNEIQIDRQLNINLEFPLYWHVSDIFPRQYFHIWIFTFNGCLEFYCKRDHNKFTQSPVDGHFGCFQSFASMNEAAIISRSIHHTLWKYVELKQAKLILEVLEDWKLVTLGKGWWLKSDTKRVSGLLVIFCFWIWVLITRVCSDCGNSSKCILWVLNFSVVTLKLKTII